MSLHAVTSSVIYITLHMHMGKCNLSVKYHAYKMKILIFFVKQDTR